MILMTVKLPVARPLATGAYFKLVRQACSILNRDSAQLRRPSTSSGAHWHHCTYYTPGIAHILEAYFLEPEGARALSYSATVPASASHGAGFVKPSTGTAERATGSASGPGLLTGRLLLGPPGPGAWYLTGYRLHWQR